MHSIIAIMTRSSFLKAAALAALFFLPVLPALLQAANAQPAGQEPVRSEAKPIAKPEATPPPAAPPVSETAEAPAAVSDSVTAKTQGIKLSAGSDILKFEVNAEAEETGRFAIKTISGDPDRDSDDHQQLIYSGPAPVTSYTTVNIDGRPWVFGGPTNKRAGKKGVYGEIAEPPRLNRENNVFEVSTVCRLGPIQARQTLRVTPGPRSKRYDSVEIAYELLNTDSQPHEVGLRIMLDTLLGQNDGAPLRIGSTAVTTEHFLKGASVPESWLAIDRLDNPGVFARGTLQGEGLTTPDTIHIADWGTLADYPWLAPFTPGKEFKREGEFDLDSAVALYWNPETLAGGARRTIKTLYGIDYIQIRGQELIAGVYPPHLGSHSTARNQVKPISLGVLINNVANRPFHNVRARIELPPALELLDDSPREIDFGTMNGGADTNGGWRFLPAAFGGGAQVIKVFVTADESPPLSFNVDIELLSPPSLDDVQIFMRPETLKVIDGKDYDPNPFQAVVKIRNPGRSPVDNLEAELTLPEGLVFPTVQKPVVRRARIEGDGEVELSWKVIATGDLSGRMPVTVKLTSDSTEEKTVEGFLPIPALQTRLQLDPKSGETVREGQPFIVDVLLSSVKDFREADVSVCYNPDVLHWVSPAERGGMISPSDWRAPVHDRETGCLSHANGSWDQPKGFDGTRTLMGLHFMAEKAGDTGLTIQENYAIRDGKGGLIPTRLIPKTFTILPAQGDASPPAEGGAETVPGPPPEKPGG